MEEYTYIEILIEDKSGGILVEQIMQKYVLNKTNITYRIHSFKGIGKIPLKANRMSQIKSKRLLTDLPMYLKGMSSSLENMPGKKAIFVILDSDDEDCAKMKIFDTALFSPCILQCFRVEFTRIENTESIYAVGAFSGWEDCHAGVRCKN